MVGVTYRSAGARPTKGVKPFPLPQPSQPEPKVEVEPPTFRDKESYQELFKPLPKPEPLPLLVPFKIEAKSWRQLQDEREAMMNMELEKTKNEAMSMWNRTKEDDERRIAKIKEEKRRTEDEYLAREEIMRKGNEERLERDKARKEEIRRQEELLSGRKIRSKTADLTVEQVGGVGGIQIYHYKDPAVEQIVRKTNKEEIRRRMSHGEVLKLSDKTMSGFAPSISTGQVSRVSNEYKTVMNNKLDYFKTNLVPRSQSSSSNTSR